MGKKSEPSPPQAPDPMQVAQAQTGSNVTTGVANSILGNANYVTPTGSSTTSISGYQTVTDPSTGQSYQVPQFTQTQTLSPNQQKLQTQQESLGKVLNSVGLQQALKIGKQLNNPVTAPAGQIQTSLPQTSDQVVQDAYNAIMSRTAPQLQREHDQLNTQLINQGFTAGSQGYNQAIDEQNRKANDLALQANLSAEQLGNQRFNQQLQAGQFNNQGYGQQLQTDLAIRNQPINEISALMGGGQVSMPQFQTYQGGNIAGTPIGDYTYQSANLANQQYQAQMQADAQKTAGLYGAIGNVAGAGLYGGLKMSDRRIKTDIRRIGEWVNGLPIYLFRYIADPLRRTFMGFMAQDVEQITPEAVVEIGGIKHVNYALAMRG